MAVPTIFTQQAPNSIASYDWFDFAAGAGYKRFYAASCNKTGPVNVKFLTSKVVDGDLDGATAAQSTSVTNTNTEINFDITFQNPVMVAAGEAIINWTMQGSANYSAYTIFTLYHVTTGGTETSLGTITTSVSTSTATHNLRRLAKITTSAASFGVGETLRLEIKMYETANHACTWFYDPSGRQTFVESGTGATIDSSMIIDVPFRIDL